MKIRSMILFALCFSLIGCGVEDQNISTIVDGKRIDISINFNAEISKLNNKKINKAKGNVSSFGTMVGDFSLNEFDVLISNTQSELIVILSKKLETFF